MLSDNDLELLSAYLDGALNQSERAALETRLSTDATLRRELARLRATVDLIKTLPTLAAPRDFTLTRRMVRRPPTLLTSAAFSGMSAAAAVVLLVLGAALFTNSGQFPVSNLAPANQVALLVTTTALPSVMQDGLQLNTDGEQSSDVPEAVARDQRTDDIALQNTQQAQEVPRDLEIVLPTASAEAMMFAAAPESATRTEVDEFADAASDTTNQQAAEEQSQQATTMEASGYSAEPSQALTVLAPPAPSIASGAVDNAAGAAASNAPGEDAQLAATLAPEPTLLPTEKPSATLSPTASPTATPTLTETPTPTPLPTLLPVPIPAPAQTAAPGLNIGLVLIIVALLLLGVAILTTLIRRRRE